LDPSKYCIRCDASLLSVSDICPQCGCPKKISVNSDNDVLENEIEKILDEKEFINSKLQSKISLPTGVRLITIFQMVFGISLIFTAIFFVASVILLVMSSGMSSLGGIGGAANMPLPLGMGTIDPATMSAINMIIDMHSVTGFPNTNEVQGLLSSSGVLNVQVIMDVIKDASVIALVEILIGVSVLVVARSLFKGKNWARLVTVISAIISVPLLVLLLENLDNRILLGVIAIDGCILYYLMKPKVREFFSQFSQNRLKKSNIKT